MQISWKNMKAAIAELVTSKQLSVESAKLITDSAESDISAETSQPADLAPAPVAVAAPAPVPAPAVPVAAAPVAATTPANDEVATLKAQLAQANAENATLKAKVTPGLAAAVPNDDATQTSAPKVAEEENPHYADLKRIKKQYGRFGLTAEIDLGDDQ